MNIGPGFVIWLTGLPASGKTTIVSALDKRLRALGLLVETLDGDEVRRSLSSDLGFSREDREEHTGGSFTSANSYRGTVSS
jgi:adenylylsulfate kinase